jgi:DNA-binding transcriptional ArsR family regulator
MSQHLAILRDRGLVVPERRGNMTCYRLADGRIADLIREAREIFSLGIEVEAASAKA